MTATLRLSRPPRFGVRTLGYGARAVIWLQGCTLACAGCVSLDTWAPDGGVVWRVSDLVEEILGPPHPMDGLTVSGGEPFQQPAGLAVLVAAIRGRTPAGSYDVLCYSGFRREQLQRRHPDILGDLDVLVDGRYQEGRPTALPLRGSANQRLHRLSALAESRYEHADEPAPRPALQVVASDDGLELAGIPSPGELDEIERRLGERGIRLGGMSWRR